MDLDRTLGSTVGGPALPAYVPHEPRPLLAGETVGRYVLLGRLGAGGMGVVYAAYDPELDRKIALKLLLPGAAQGPGSLGKARLLREAQALARLSHPNVVTVHDVGTHADQVWVAMEFVAGRTLAAWVNERPRTWQQRLQVLTDAARGVAAAHAAGLVHRDLKPDNVMIGDDGRVRVMDFGLAHGRATPADESPASAAPSPHSQPSGDLDATLAASPDPDTPQAATATLAPDPLPSPSNHPTLAPDARTSPSNHPTLAPDPSAPVATNAATLAADALPPAASSRPNQRNSDPDLPRERALAVRLTRVGAVQGTPAYMAPEQWRGEDVDAAADQFGWSVMAWEILYDELPFAGDALPALIAAITSGTRRPPPRNRPVPKWLRRAIERGLAVEPARRWPSMAALLAALERGRGRARVRTIALALTGAAAIAAAVAGHARWDHARRVAACDEAGAAIDRVWNDDTRRQTREAFAASGLSFAAASADRAIAWLDARALAWKHARTETCLDADIDHRRDQDLVDRALWCLEDRRLELESLVSEFARANTVTVQQAVAAASGLDSAAQCTDTRVLEHRPAPPADQREALGAVRATLSRARSLSLAGNYSAALELARAARAAAEVQQWPPLLLATRAAEGQLLAETGAHAEAEATTTETYYQAAQAGVWDVASSTTIQLISTVGVAQARPADGRAWSRHAAVAIAHAGDGEGLHESQRLIHLAEIHHFAGEYADAQALLERALAIRERVFGADHPAVTTVLSDLADIHLALGKFDEARAINERVLAVEQRVLGPEHPDIGQILQDLALAYQGSGAHTEALALHERALAVLERALGPEHPNIALTLNNIANVHMALGEYPEARRLHERALAIFERSFGPEHPKVAMSLVGLGGVLVNMGEPSAARVPLERALAIFEATLGSDHPHVGVTMANLGNVLRDLGAHPQAITRYERALAILEKAVGPDHLDLAILAVDLARSRAATSAYPEARALLARAVAIREQALGPDHADVASARAELAELERQAPRR